MLRKNKHSETLWGGPLRENSNKYWKKNKKKYLETLWGGASWRKWKNQKNLEKTKKKTIFEDSWLVPPIHQDLWKIVFVFFFVFCFFRSFLVFQIPWLADSCCTCFCLQLLLLCVHCSLPFIVMIKQRVWSSHCCSVSAPQLSANDRHPCFLTFPLQTFRCGRHPSQVHFCDDYGNGTRQRWPHGGGHWRRYPRGVSWLKRTGQAIGPNPSPAPWLRPDHTDNDNESEWVDIPEGDAAPQTPVAMSDDERQVRVQFERSNGNHWLRSGSKTSSWSYTQMLPKAIAWSYQASSMTMLCTAKRESRWRAFGNGSFQSMFVWCLIVSPAARRRWPSRPAPKSSTEPGDSWRIGLFWMSTPR